MVYVALLRGINVGGNNKIEMAKLKNTFEQLGFAAVKTFIASGNVVFRTADARSKLVERIEAAIARDFKLKVSVLLRDLPEMKKVVKALPASWRNDGEMKCDVMFLWKAADKPAVLKQFQHRPDIEDLRYVKGAVLWRVDRKHQPKSRIPKVVGTPLHQQMTVRNCNTARKLLELMVAAEDA